LNDERVRAETGDLRPNGGLRPLANREHGNYRRDPHDHAQHGQGRTQGVPPQGTVANADGHEYLRHGLAF
jgi:hypothetical protein